MDRIELIRQIIEGCDDALRDAFLRRMEAAVDIAQAKVDKGLDIGPDENEEQILAHITQGLSGEMSIRAMSLWRTLMRLFRGRQYRYVIQSDASFTLSYEHDIVTDMPDGIVLCPQSMLRSVSSALGMEVKPASSIQSALRALAAAETEYAAVELESFSETDWLYSIMLSMPIYINTMVRTSEGRLIALLSRKIVDSSERGIITLAYSVDRETRGSLSQSLAIFADSGINIEHMRVRPPQPDDESRGTMMVFVEILGRLSDTEVRATLLQLERETAFFRMLGYRGRI